MSLAFSSSNSSARRWLFWGPAVLFAVLAVPYALKAVQGRSAIVRWQPQLLDLENGEDISGRYRYPNPPIMAVMLYPLAKLPPLAAALTWFGLKAGLTVLALGWVFRMVAAGDRPFPVWAATLALVLSLRPIIGDLQHGNVNLFIFFLVMAGLYAYARGRDVAAGLLLALATACKITPGLFLPYLVWKRAGRTVAAFLLGLGLFLWPGVVPALFLGARENQQQFASWYHEMVYPFLVEGKATTRLHNQSLPGLVHRLLTRSPSYEKWDYEVQAYVPLRFDNLLALDPAAARGVVRLCMALFVLGIVCWCRTPSGQRSGWRACAEHGVVLLGMLLFSERTWKHHGVTLVLPFAVLCYVLAVHAHNRRWRGFLIGSLALTTFLMASASTGLLPDEWARQAQSYGAFVAAFLVLTGTLFVLLRASLPLAARTQPGTMEAASFPSGDSRASSCVT
jgi:hypothetical protein